MLRALAIGLMLASTSSAIADDADEDPKRAIRDRGFVLQAGKRHFFVIVPPAEMPDTAPDTSRLYADNKLYFGDAKALSPQGTLDYYFRGEEDWESRGLMDARNLMSGWVIRRGNEFVLECAPAWDGTKKRTIKLSPGSIKSIERAALREAPKVRVAFFLARVPGTTTYVYVDRSESDSDLRLFMGKRGAMKRIPVKDLAADASSTVMVTAKGTLTIKRDRTAPAAATFGTAKKPTNLELLSPYSNDNKKLIYTELGVYTHERTGYACDEL